MGKKSNRTKLDLTDEQKENLLKLSQAGSAPLREVQRSRILLKYAEGSDISSIAKQLNTTRSTVYKCIDKALSMGIEIALKDTYHRPREPVITEEAKNWVISLACKKPKDLGHAAEFWTRKSLAEHVKDHAEENGHPCLKKSSQGHGTSNPFTASDPAPQDGLLLQKPRSGIWKEDGRSLNGL